jgi:hypothetical protein
VLGGSHQILRMVLEFYFIFTVSENCTGPYQIFNIFHFVQFLDIPVLTNQITTSFKPGSPPSSYLVQNARK